MQLMIKNILSLALFLFSSFIFSQVGIGTTSPTGALDVSSSTNGILIPRVALTAKNVAAPIVNPQGGALENSTLVYNTATAGVSPNDVVPGFYYWESLTSTWKPMVATSSGWSLTGNSGTNPAVNFIGTTDNANLVFKRNNVRAGLIGINTISLGVNALNPLSTGVHNIAFGVSSLSADTSGGYNISIGFGSMLKNTVGNFNTSVGNQALSENLSGISNAAFGDYALRSNVDGHQNSAFGTNALITNANGSQNSAYGVGSLYFASGSFNTGLGYFALSNLQTGSSNIGIGNQAQVPNINGNNQLSIGNQIYGKDMNDAFLGKIGIGEPNPTEKLDVSGNLKIAGAFMPNNLSGNFGEVLASNGAGAAPSWVNSTVKPYITTSGTGVYNVALTEYTVRVYNGVSNVRLPDATTNLGKVFIIIGSNGISSKTFSTLGGVIYDDVTNANITSIAANQRYMVQSDGTDWIVIGR
jgi:hypothetical protein